MPGVHPETQRPISLGKGSLRAGLVMGSFGGCRNPTRVILLMVQNSEKEAWCQGIYFFNPTS
jgi:hypothetical protein